MEAAACLTDDPEDTWFIRRPTPAEEKEWASICMSCPVAMQCIEWADENSPSSVFIAGEWCE